MKWHIGTLAVMVLIAASCSKSKSGSKAPEISFQNLQPNVIKNGSPEDNVFIYFRVKDENADLGNDQSGTKKDIFMTDSRDTQTVEFFFPTIPNELQDARKGIDGICTLKLNGALFFTLRDDHQEGDTLHYDIYVKDKAGNSSNHITTPDIYITP